MSRGTVALDRLLAMWDVDERRKSIYIDRLADIPDHELEAVCNQALDTCKFLPSIAELKEIHQQLRSGGLVDTQRSGEQWGQVRKAIWAEGYMWKPRFKDPITATVVEQIGWYELCITPEAELSGNMMVRFMRLYEQESKKLATQARVADEYRRLQVQYQERLLTSKETTSNGTSIIKFS